ncbi:MAG: helix-turn-helix domain-containing protein [Chloroflexota bacterium]|nr:helix-turn-helix domain-containing protein [Chloroflexota bacterium]
MVRARKKKANDVKEESRGEAEHDALMDVNAVVSYNVKDIREQRGWTQQSVAERLARLTNHLLPQASISAMERGFDGDRRRRFDAHELYLLSVVFDVPISYFFLPPPEPELALLADTHRPVDELYPALLGQEWQLPVMDKRLADISVENPEKSDRVLKAIFGAEGASRNWFPHYRTWRKKRIQVLKRQYSDGLDEAADFFADFAEAVKALGPEGYLQSQAHRPGEEAFDPTTPTEE